MNICGFELKVSITIGSIAIKLGTDFHVPLRMNSNNFADSFLSCTLQIKILIHPILWLNTCKTNDIPASLSCRSNLYLVLINIC